MRKKTNSLVNSISGSPELIVDLLYSGVVNWDSEVCVVLTSRVENTGFVVFRPTRVDSSEVPPRVRDRRGSRRFNMSRDSIVDDILTK